MPRVKKADPYPYPCIPLTYTPEVFIPLANHYLHMSIYLYVSTCVYSLSTHIYNLSTTFLQLSTVVYSSTTTTNIYQQLPEFPGFADVQSTAPLADRYCHTLESNHRPADKLWTSLKCNAAKNADARPIQPKGIFRDVQSSLKPALYML